MRDTALAIGDRERAVQGAKAAIDFSPRLSDYLQLKELAGDRWPPMREEILSGLRQSKVTKPRAGWIFSCTKT